MSKSVAFGLLISYLFFVLSITVFSRGFKVKGFNIIPPFWAYKMIIIGDSRARELIAEIMMNILMLAPLGFLIPFITKKYPLCIAMGCSIGIELIQLVTKRGYFELDDIIHNTIGILLGYMFYRLLKKIAIDRK